MDDESRQPLLFGDEAPSEPGPDGQQPQALQDGSSVQDQSAGPYEPVSEEPEADYMMPEEEELYRMKELIQENPRDVIQYIEEEGMVKLGEFDAQDYLVFKAMGGDTILTHGSEHLDVAWKAMWSELLDKYDQGAQGSGWSKLCTVEAHAVSIRDAAKDGPRGLLQPLVKRYQARACKISVFGLPAVHAVISYKWNTWARRFLLYELGLYLLWLVSYTAFTLLYEYEEEEQSLDQLLTTQLGVATVVSNVVALAAMLPFMYMEVCTVVAYGLGWFNLWNALDLACYLLQFTISLVHLHRRYLDGDTFPILLSLQHILLWSKLHYFARVLTPTKNILVDTLRIVIADMSWFLTFMGLLMLGFAFAFYSLFRHDREDSADFTNFWHALASMFSYLLAMFDFNIFYNSTNAPMVFILFVIYEFVMYIVLLNIMIAIMTSSFNKITQDENLRYLCSQAQIVDELETTLPHWLKRSAWFPSFVHVLKVHPSSTFGHMSLSKIMSNIGSLESNLLAAQEDMRCRMDAVDAKFAAAHARLETAAKLMDSLLASPSGKQELAS